MLRLAIGILGLTIARAAFAQGHWLLTTADFNSESVQLKSLNASAVTVSPATGGADRTISMDRFLELSRTLPQAQSAAKFVLHMTGGDQIVGEPVNLTADSLVWKSPELGEIAIPTSRMAAITPPGKPGPAERGHQDVIRFGNGDSVSGIITSMTGEKITIQTPAGNSDVPIASVASINFAATPGPAGGPQRGFRVRLDDGSSLVGSDVKLDGAQLILSMGQKAASRISVEHVTAIEQVNGPVSWLSSRTPSEAVYYPLIGPAREPSAYMGQSWGGQHPIEFKGRIFAHGIGVHALSRMTWNLDGKYEVFRTRYAIDGDGAVADATVRILLDGKVVYEQPHVHAGTLSPVILEDLKGAKKLTLEVDGPYYAQDSLDWIEPALLRRMPAPAATEPLRPAPQTEPAGGK